MELNLSKLDLLVILVHTKYKDRGLQKNIQEVWKYVQVSLNDHVPHNLTYIHDIWIEKVVFVLDADNDYNGKIPGIYFDNMNDFFNSISNAVIKPIDKEQLKLLLI